MKSTNTLNERDSRDQAFLRRQQRRRWLRNWRDLDFLAREASQTNPICLSMRSPIFGELKIIRRLKGLRLSSSTSRRQAACPQGHRLRRERHPAALRLSRVEGPACVQAGFSYPNSRG